VSGQPRATYRGGGFVVLPGEAVLEPVVEPVPFDVVLEPAAPVVLSCVALEVVLAVLPRVEAAEALSSDIELQAPRLRASRATPSAIFGMAMEGLPVATVPCRPGANRLSRRPVPQCNKCQALR